MSCQIKARILQNVFKVLLCYWRPDFARCHGNLIIIVNVLRAITDTQLSSLAEMFWKART